MNKLATITAATLVALTLAGCSGPVAGETPENPLAREWVATPEGDLNCLVSSATHGHFTVDCDWTTLTDLRTHTTENSLVVDGAWTFIDQQEVFCLITPTTHGHQSTNCDWANPR